MRISTSWNQQLSVNAMLDQQAKLSKTQIQLSTGLKLTQPSDDTVAATQILAFKDEIDQTRQYLRNIDTARERNMLEESALENAENIMFRAKELTIQAANATLTPNDKLSIKEEIDRMLENLLSIANTRNANGEYIFAGYLSKTKPFDWDSNLNGYEFLGSNDQRSIQINQHRTIADGDTGLDVFQNINSVSQDASVGNGTRSIFNTIKSLSDLLAGSYANPTAIIQGPQFVNTPLTLTAGTSVTLDSDNPAAPVNVNLAGTYNNLDDLVTVFNTNPALTGAGIKAQSNGNFLEFVSTTQGASSSISITAMSGNFGVETGFSAGDTGTGIDLSPPVTQPDQLYFTLTDEILTDLDTSLESLLQTRTAVGSRLRALDNQQAQHETFILDLETNLSNIQDLDYTEAITRFNIQNTALQASQQAFTRVQNLSLFNFL